jgi:hypothetical protein
MTTEQTQDSGLTRMPVSRALAKLKTMKANIDSALTESVRFFHITQGTDSVRMLTPGETIDSARAKAQAALQSFEKLQSNYIAIKAAIAASNAVTLVTINDKVYTIAAAMELKKLQDVKIKMQTLIRKQHIEASAAVRQNNEKLDKDLATDKKEASSALSEAEQQATLEQLQKIQRNLAQTNLLDCIGYDKVSERLKAETDAIKTDLDYVLNESNMVTFIEVDLR